MSETRTVHFKIDPALQAYLAWLDEDGLAFSPAGFDLFAAGYRAHAREAARPATDELEGGGA